MGVWQGIAQAYKDISAERAREKEIREEREYRIKEKEEDRAFAKEQALEKIRLSFQTEIAKDRLSRASSSEKASEIVTSAKQLQAMGVDPTLIKRMVDTGDATAITNFTKAVGSQFSKAAEAGRGDEYITSINLALEEGEYTPSTSRSVFEGLGDAFKEGGPLSAESLGLEDAEYVIPGSATIKTPMYVANPEIPEYGTFETEVLKTVQATAEREISSLDKISRQLAEALEKGSDPLLLELREAVTSRTKRVAEAQKAYKEGKDPAGLLGIYGTQAVELNLQRDPRFDLNLLNDYMRNNLKLVPLAVPRKAVAITARRLGYNMPIVYNVSTDPNKPKLVPFED